MQPDSISAIRKILRENLPQASDAAIDAAAPGTHSLVSQLRALVVGVPEFEGTDEEAAEAAIVGRERSKRAAQLSGVELDDSVFRAFTARTWAMVSLWPDQALAALALALAQNSLHRQKQ